jgi:hypothetical protein
MRGTGMTDQATSGAANVVVDEPLLKVWPVVPADGDQSPTMTIRWSTSPALPALLASNNGLRPYLLVVVENEGRESSRQVFPIRWASGRVIAKWSGKNTFHCTVVWLKNRGNPKGVLLEKDQKRYAQSLLEQDPDSERLARISEAANFCMRKMRSGIKVGGRAYRGYETRYNHLQDEMQEVKRTAPWKLRQLYRVCRILEEVSFSVFVLPDAFGDPADQTVWTRFLARIYPWWRKPSKNTCVVRGRATFTLCTLPIALAVAIVSAAFMALIGFGVALANLVTAAIMGSLGYRGLNWQPIWKPWTGGPPTVIKNASEESLWFYKRIPATESGDEDRYVYVHQPLWVQALCPVVLVICALGVLAVLDHARMGWFQIGVTILFWVYIFFIEKPVMRRKEARLAAQREDYDGRRQADADVTEQLAERLAGVTDAPGQRGRGSFSIANTIADFKEKVCRSFEAPK